MEINVTKDVVKFEPIKVSVDFTITSYEELAEFIKFSNDVGDVSHYNGANSRILSELLDKISNTVAEGL